MIILFNQYFTDGVAHSALPINLLSIATYIKSKGLPVKVYEAISPFNVTRILKKEKPTIVGIGAQFTPHFKVVLDIARIVKAVNPDILTVIGGNHASSLNELPPNIDRVIQGEGERAFYDLCMCNNNADIVKPYPLMDIDTLPIIDYSLCDMNYYSYTSPYTMRSPSFPIVTSRGCPNNCIYCTVKGVWGRSWRGKSVQRVVNEIECLVNMGFKEFHILDDSASVDRVRWVGICDEIIKRKLDIRWTLPNGIAHWTLDYLVLNKMKKAGCYRMTFGIESGNERIRKFIGKPYKLPLELIRYANSIGIWTMATNIIGFPTETEQEMLDTLNFNKRNGVDFAAFFPLDSYPTADIFKYEVDLTLAKRLHMKFYRSFMIHRILTFYTVFQKIHSFEDLRYVTRMMISGFKIFFKAFYNKTTHSILYKEG